MESAAGIQDSFSTENQVPPTDTNAVAQNVIPDPPLPELDPLSQLDHHLLAIGYVKAYTVQQMIVDAFEAHHMTLGAITEEVAKIDAANAALGVSNEGVSSEPLKEGDSVRILGGEWGGNTGVIKFISPDDSGYCTVSLNGVFEGNENAVIPVHFDSVESI